MIGVVGRDPGAEAGLGLLIGVVGRDVCAELMGLFVGLVGLDEDLEPGVSDVLLLTIWVPLLLIYNELLVDPFDLMRPFCPLLKAKSGFVERVAPSFFELSSVFVLENCKDIYNKNLLQH